MPVLDIRGVPVDFPFEPYDCQRIYMEKVIQALQTGQHALLESPTGTGKTLCLLCATLAWRGVQSAAAQAVHGDPQTGLQYSAGASSSFFQTPGAPAGAAGLGAAGLGGAPSNLGTIVYTSRTHSQLSQVVRELKNTSYAPKICILGSRQQLCVHPRVSQESGSVQNNMCRTLCASRSCKFKNNNEIHQRQQGQQGGAGAGLGMMDIEELANMGRSQSLCPFFLSRDAMGSADLVLMPYNYLLDASVRATLQIKWERAVLIFDEAHNVEDVAASSASFDISTADIASWLEETDQACTLAQEPLYGGELDLSELLILKGFLLELERKVDSLKLVPGASPPGLTKGGEFMYELLGGEGLRLSPENADLMRAVVQKLVDELGAEGGGSRRQKVQLEEFVSVLDKLYRDPARIPDICRAYKVRTAGYCKLFEKLHLHLHLPRALSQQQPLICPSTVLGACTGARARA
jgi:regulator of telomere elongation helicase 1